MRVVEPVLFRCPLIGKPFDFTKVACRPPLVRDRIENELVASNDLLVGLFPCSGSDVGPGGGFEVGQRRTTLGHRGL
jgi:hypothetical protein